nr:MAG TPA: hypothetical protein [Caudoviricetes sp.]
MNRTGGLKNTPCLYQHRPVLRAKNEKRKNGNGKKLNWS